MVGSWVWGLRSSRLSCLGSGGFENVMENTESTLIPLNKYSKSLNFFFERQVFITMFFLIFSLMIPRWFIYIFFSLEKS